MASTKRILERAINTYGKDTQLQKTQEELAELITAIGHYFCKRDGAENEVIEEIADAIIMLWQCRIMFDSRKIDTVIEQKTTRLERRLDEVWRYDTVIS